ncbi:hypothetical protein PATSB16_32190 [Pandoraea thiooxydans]|uniref:Glycosyltransferase subfamily 4-like N-terminal domain-containing protein n=1 Tax=Pandoraea thiooxydans TaxID=445709 RepID=A0A0G3EPY2_9BURK|nr:glycosyltransferase family 4 protein [Pandoraea thiooxydans]AKJ69015.1 hypothetical protein ABW99_13170 [Pandoraea thiooxydans]APR96557.1 hypothetical protein PATSB16_32190 [Pandoraea thiooxydans]
MKILVLSRYDRLGASSRVRMFQYFDAPGLEGIEWSVQPLLDDDYLRAVYEKRSVSRRYLIFRYLRRVYALLLVRKYDLLWIEKELFPGLPALAERILARFKIPYVLDIDDAVFHSYDQATSPFKRLLRHKIDVVMNRAALVFAGNEYLANRALNAGSRKVEIIPTVIDIKRYPLRSVVRSGQLITIGWIGSPATVKFLQPVLPALDALRTRYAFELVVVGARMENHGRDYIRCVEWRETTEVSEIEQFDIGIMPLPDLPWERGKCGYKLIQYMACSKPVVASPVGVNCNIVRSSENGYLATTESEWLDAFSALCGDAALRERLGKSGRELVESCYSQQKLAPRLDMLFRAVVENGGATQCAG